MASTLFEDTDHGDFIESEDEVESDAEPRDRYLQGVYCPLRLGQVLDSRYRIEHKLGWGGFSTVWLASDMEQNTVVALKVIASGPWGEIEHAIQQEILRTVNDISTLTVSQAVFKHPGRAIGTFHTVLVLPVRGPSLDRMCRKIPASVRVPAIKSLLLSLKSLHDAGIVHRDLNSGAVLWSIDPMDSWTTAEIYEHMGRPRKVRLTPDEGEPGELVEAIQFRPEILRAPVHLCDFGHSIRSGTIVTDHVHGPPLFNAIEKLHGMNPNFATDMWSFTCLFAKMYLGTEAFWGTGPGLVSRVIGTLGRPLPEHWRGHYAVPAIAEDWWYEQTSEYPRPQHRAGYETLEHKIDRMRPDICAEERGHALSIMRKGFCYEQEDRITASQLLEDPSFKALMSFYVS